MKDCIHFEICAYRERYNECVPDCSCYKSGDVVKVVRCRDCKHWVHTDGEGMGDCTHSRFHLDDCPDPTMNHDEFCALGERRTSE